MFGEPVILERLLGLNFEISMESFFQTNPKSAERLYTKAISYATEKRDLSNQVLMDLFCGTGTIGQIMASQIENQRHDLLSVNEELIDRRHFIESVLSNISSAVINVNAKKQILFANESSKKIFNKDLRLKKMS